MKIVHFADLHLDSAFAWCGATGKAARQRRQALRDVLRAITRLSQDTNADALFCGGDLYEHERATHDTAAFLRQTFADLHPMPVYIAPGNHDWYGPQSIYATEEWSENVHIFSEPHLRPIALAPGITLWGAAHCAPANTGNFLVDFSVGGPGVHIALFHGSEDAWFAEQEEGKQPHAPFDAAELPRAGIHHAFLGHYHRPRDGERHTYPGNPDPLQFGEDGPRAPVIAEIAPDGSVTRERRSVAVTRVHDIALDVTGCETREQVRDALHKQTSGLNGVVRLTVRGDMQESVDVSEPVLHEALNYIFDAAQIRSEGLRPAYNFEAIRAEPTVRGQFVSDVLDAGLPPDEERRVLTTGLRALDGRNDLEVL